MPIFSYPSSASFRLAAALAILLAGCPAPSRQPAGKGESAAPALSKLSLLVVDDPQLGQAIAREWKSRTEEALDVRDATLADVAAAARLPADVVIFPAGMVGQFAELGLIQPLDTAVLEEPAFHYRDIFDQIRLREMKWGNRTLAVPLGSPQLLLAYRADIFEKMGLSPPTDWVEYQQIVERLADRSVLGDLAPPAEQPWHAAIEPLVEGWAGQMLLARAAAYALHRDQISPLFDYNSLAPLVDRPPYVRALEELAGAAKAAGFAAKRLTASEAMDELLAGRCAMAITWPAPDAAGSARFRGAKADKADKADKSDKPGAKADKREAKADQDARPIAFALLPGGRRAYRFATKTWEERGEEDDPHVPLLAVSGRMAAVTSVAASSQRAAGFVVWLAGRDVSNVIGPQSRATTLFRLSQLPDAPRWTGSLSPDAARQYAEVLSQAMTLPRAFPGVRLPGRLEYLAALDRAVHEALSGDQPAAKALATAAAKWREITDKIGLESQRRANARSFGQESL